MKHLQSYKLYEDEKPSYMTKQHLESLAQKAQELAAQLTGEEELESWVEAHIAEAYTSLNQVYDFLKHGEPQKISK